MDHSLKIEPAKRMLSLQMKNSKSKTKHMTHADYSYL
jgi:hypothetical protein